MAKLTTEEFKNATQGKGLDDIVNSLKGMTGYDAYVESVNNKEKDSKKTLQIIGMLNSLTDPSFSAMFTSVSMDITYAMADAKLRAEILQSKEEQ